MGHPLACGVAGAVFRGSGEKGRSRDDQNFPAVVHALAGETIHSSSRTSITLTAASAGGRPTSGPDTLQDRYLRWSIKTRFSARSTADLAESFRRPALTDRPTSLRLSLVHIRVRWEMSLIVTFG
jgi:hypothetical protein